jgi:hypothetical protein
MKVYVVKECLNSFSPTVRVYAKYEDAVSRAEELAEYGGFERDGDCWYNEDDLENIEIETHEVIQ